jgi:hyperosmotically inducible protein
MKRHLGSILAALTLAACGDQPASKAAVATPAPVAAPAPAPVAAVKEEAPKPDPNKELAQRVKRALEAEAKIQAAGIDVTASGGTVTLWGTAASSDERTRASRAAYRVPGVTMVDNKLAVVKGS